MLAKAALVILGKITQKSVYEIIPWSLNLIAVFLVSKNVRVA